MNKHNGALSKAWGSCCLPSVPLIAHGGWWWKNVSTNSERISSTSSRQVSQYLKVESYHRIYIYLRKHRSAWAKVYRSSRPRTAPNLTRGRPIWAQNKRKYGQISEYFTRTSPHATTIDVVWLYQALALGYTKQRTLIAISCSSCNQCPFCAKIGNMRKPLFNLPRRPPQTFK